MIIVALVLATAAWVLFARRRNSVDATPHGRRIDRVLINTQLGAILQLIGWVPSFGYVQLAVLDSALRQRTLSVTGEVWIPAEMSVELSASDRGLIAHLERTFLRQIAEVITSTANEKGWRIDRSARLTIVETETAGSGRPIVRGVFSSERPPSQSSDSATPQEFGVGATAVIEPEVGHLLPPTELRPGLVLALSRGDAAGVSLGSADDSCVLGRGADVDVHVDGRSVSRRHCQLSRARGGWTIRDLGSSNGTRVNGERIALERLLVEGDIIDLGDKTSFRCESWATKPSRTA